MEVVDWEQSKVFTERLVGQGRDRGVQIGD